MCQVSGPSPRICKEPVARLPRVKASSFCVMMAKPSTPLDPEYILAPMRTFTRVPTEINSRLYGIAAAEHFLAQFQVLLQHIGQVPLGCLLPAALLRAFPGALIQILKLHELFYCCHNPMRLKKKCRVLIAPSDVSGCVTLPIHRHKGGRSVSP